MQSTATKLEVLSLQDISVCTGIYTWYGSRRGLNSQMWARSGQQRGAGYGRVSLERLISLAIHWSCRFDLWSQKHVHSCYKCFRDIILHTIIPDRCWYPSKSTLSGGSDSAVPHKMGTQRVLQHLVACCCPLCLQDQGAQLQQSPLAVPWWANTSGRVETRNGVDKALRPRGSLTSRQSLNCF